MFPIRSVLVLSLIALAAPAFAADPPPQSTRDERMDAALKDFESGKPPMVVPMPAPPAHAMKSHSHMK